MSGTGTTNQGDIVPTSKMRRAIARTMSYSAREVPQGQVDIDVDMSAVAAARSALAATHAVSLTDYLIAAAGRALLHEPALNSSWHDVESTLRHGGAHIALVYATEDGMLNPVVRDAHARSVGEIAAERRRLEEAVRAGSLAARDLLDATFTISNLGPFGIPRFRAVINPPQAGILAVGAVQERPVVEEGEITVRAIATFTLTIDHRVADGAHAARFLAYLRGLLERPARLNS